MAVAPSWLQPDETAFDLMKRAGYGQQFPVPPRFGVEELDRLLPPTLPAATAVVLEIEGESGWGKTLLLVQLAKSVLKDTAHEQGCILYFNLDKRLDVGRFQAQDDEEDEESFKRVLVASPDDCVEFLMCLHHLTANHTVRLVVIDSLLSLHEFSSLTDPLASGFPVSIPRVLFDLAKKLGFAIAAAKPVPTSSSSAASSSSSLPAAAPGGGGGGDEICSKTWSQNVSLRIALRSSQWGELWDSKRNVELGKFGIPHHAPPPSTARRQRRHL